MTKVVHLVRQFYVIADELTRLTGRKFTPDGHMVGSAGEVFVEYLYGLELFESSEEGHDARKGDLLVQIKMTGGDKKIGISSEPKQLLVLQLKGGSPEEVFNGPGSLAWSSAGPLQKNGQRQIALARLRALMSEVPKDKQLKKERSLE